MVAEPTCFHEVCPLARGEAERISSGKSPAYFPFQRNWLVGEGQLSLAKGYDDLDNPSGAWRACYIISGTHFVIVGGIGACVNPRNLIPFIH